MNRELAPQESIPIQPEPKEISKADFDAGLVYAQHYWESQLKEVIKQLQSIHEMKEGAKTTLGADMRLKYYQNNMNFSFNAYPKEKMGFKING